MRQGALLAGLLLMLAASSAADSRCPGDCDGDGRVTVAEFQFATTCPGNPVGQPPTEECLDCLGVSDGEGIPISLLIQVANNAVMGCPDNPRCDGDCDGDRRVIVAELLYGVDAALNGIPADDPCPEFVFCPPGEFCIRISDLQRAVGNALRGCP